jgi:radical SAM superfamily enzyme YgiQ (UPF0313 family)
MSSTGNPIWPRKGCSPPGRTWKRACARTGCPFFPWRATSPYRFDIIGFSLLYELNYSNILTVLDLGGIPFLSKERKTVSPLLLAGGPAAFNPEPVSDIFDAFLIGDGEEAFLEIADSSPFTAGGRDHLLSGLAEIPGVYVPGLYESYTPPGSRLLARRPKAGAPARIKKRIKANLGEPPYPEAIIVPDIQAVFDRVTIEVARGCPQRCRFCQATGLYFPFRFRDPGFVRQKVRRSLEATGLQDVSLSALSISDYPYLEETVTSLMEELPAKISSLSLRSGRGGIRGGREHPQSPEDRFHSCARSRHGPAAAGHQQGTRQPGYPGCRFHGF